MRKKIFLDFFANETTQTSMSASEFYKKAYAMYSLVQKNSAFESIINNNNFEMIT